MKKMDTLEIYTVLCDFNIHTLKQRGSFQVEVKGNVLISHCHTRPEKKEIFCIFGHHSQFETQANHWMEILQHDRKIQNGPRCLALAFTHSANCFSFLDVLMDWIWEPTFLQLETVIWCLDDKCGCWRPSNNCLCAL